MPTTVCRELRAATVAPAPTKAEKFSTGAVARATSGRVSVDSGAVIYVDAPIWPAHGTVFAHVISDDSAAELHAFAARAGLDPRSWDGDHYDVPLRRYDDVVRAGATVVDGRTITRLLASSGLRFRKRKGERPLASVADALPGVDVPHRFDILRSTLLAPDPTVAAGVFVHDAAGSLLLVSTVRRGGWEAPAGGREPGESVHENAVREVEEETGLRLDAGSLTPVGYERLHLERPTGRWPERTNHIQVFTTTLDVVAPPVRPRDGETTRAAWVPPRDAARLVGSAVHWPLLRDHLDRR